MLRRLVVPLSSLVLAALVAGATVARAAEVVHLTRWEETAYLIPNRGPGPSYYALTARVSWKEKGSGRFVVQVVLPGGQVEKQPLGGNEGYGAQHLTVLVRSNTVRNLRPADVRVRVSLADEVSGAVVSNVLTATILDFPRPEPGNSFTDDGPFGWGTPLSGPPNEPRPLPRPGPDDVQFVRILPEGDAPGVFIATTEATNAQLIAHVPDYNPLAGRSDEFQLEDPKQPAQSLSPRQAIGFLSALGKSDRSGVSYRLPTRAEWLRAALADKTSAFWWGDEPTHPAGANFLGPEPTLPTDTTAPSMTPEGKPGFEPNPWGLFHTFGNVAEWATGASGGFVRLGGHFRSEPKTPQPEVEVAQDDATGPDPYVGVRAVLDLDAEKGAELVRRALKGNAGLEPVEVAFDPDRATVTLTGRLLEPSLRHSADRRLQSLWFLAAVEDRIETPKNAPGQLARLGALAGPARRITPLGRWFYEIPIEVRWAKPLPVRGSLWFVNVYLPGGRSFGHPMVPAEPDRSGRVTVLIDRARMLAEGLAVDAPVTVSLSLGDEAPTPADPRVVSNIVPLTWRLP